MNYDVFISYSSKDQKIVEAMSHYLEERGVRCFVAYRDIPKGKVWASAITEAIENCRVMVVVFSKEFNMSDQVDREIELCSEEKKPILTFRIQEIEFTGAKKYYLKNLNWIDAFPNPNSSFSSLYESVTKLIGNATPSSNKERENSSFTYNNSTPIKKASHSTDYKKTLFIGLIILFIATIVGSLIYAGYVTNAIQNQNLNNQNPYENTTENGVEDAAADTAVSISE